LDAIKVFRGVVYELHQVDAEWDQEDWNINDNLPAQEFVNQTLDIVKKLFNLIFDCCQIPAFETGKRFTNSL
jgi:hypothetical protein